jgi:hypothetical protein
MHVLDERRIERIERLRVHFIDDGVCDELVAAYVYEQCVLGSDSDDDRTGAGRAARCAGTSDFFRIAVDKDKRLDGSRAIDDLVVDETSCLIGPMERQMFTGLISPVGVVRRTRDRLFDSVAQE